jgi:cystathionine beta-lyase/cystathionine gamma-synthase
MNMATIAVHAGADVGAASGAIAPLITMSVTFARDGDGAYRRGYTYTRERNPNRNALESACAALQGGSGAVAFASGCAAITAVQRTLTPGDHVLIPEDVSQGTVRLLTQVLPRWQITHTAVNMTDVRATGGSVSLGARGWCGWRPSPTRCSR